MIYKNNICFNYDLRNLLVKNDYQERGPVVDFEHCCSKEFPTLSQAEISEDGTIREKYLVYIMGDVLLAFTGWLIRKYGIFFIKLTLVLAFLMIIFGEFGLAILSLCLIGIWGAIYLYTQPCYMIKAGISAFNNTEYQKAYNLFTSVQKRLPLLAQELNDWVLLCLIKLEKYDEALNYIDTHNVSAGSAKKMTIYSETNRLNDALNLFFDVYGKEINKYPLTLIFPTKIIEYRKNLESAIEFLEKNYIENNEITKKNYTLFEYYYQLCKKAQQTEKEEKIQNQLKDFRELIYLKSSLS
nr:MAG TPA: putative lipoprotein [Caudoviricetes sp.]